MPPIKCEANCAPNSLKVLMELGVSLLNHTCVGPLVGKVQYMISSAMPCKCMRVLNDSRWSKRSFDSSYASTYGIQNFCGRGNKVTGAVKGKSILWTNSSRSLDTRPLRVFIIKSILSFITCIFATMCGGIVSVTNRRLVSCHSYLLGALLPFGSS